ncbi:MAG: L-fucose isomerase [Kiritimatiellia bacterium]|jgi:L-fucose isomerase
MKAEARPDFAKLASTSRSFQDADQRLIGALPAIAITPVADGRPYAHDSNVEKTWRMAEKVYDIIKAHVCYPDGTPVRVVVAPEIVYGPRSGARAQAYYSTQAVCANIWVARSWCYSDELMSACQGLGSSEWQQCAYGLNQTDRPGAVWLKSFTAAMDEKNRPVFCIYNPDLEDEDGPLCDYVATRILRFARCATAVGYMRGKNFLGVGGVSMGIVGSDLRRNIMLQTFGMGSASFDMSGLNTRINEKFYDKAELDRACEWFTKTFKIAYGHKGNDALGLSRPRSKDDLVRRCLLQTILVRDLMQGNAKLARRCPSWLKGKGYQHVEWAQGYNALGAGTQGQRQWTDGHPNFDVTESLLNSMVDWNGFRTPYIVATENDGKNGIGMIVGHLLSGGMSQMFADIRTNWTPASIKKATGTDVSKICPRGIIDKRNSGAAALEYAVDLYKICGCPKTTPIQDVVAKLRANEKLQAKLAKEIGAAVTYMGADLCYFPGDGLSSHFRSPGGLPLTSYRYNVVDEKVTCSVVEGDSVDLPKDVGDKIGARTDPTWPETHWMPRGMTSFEYMSRIGPNHDGSSLGLIGADFITFNAMLRIPVDMHNVAKEDIFRPTMWDRFGGDDFRVCQKLGPVYR